MDKIKEWKYSRDIVNINKKVSNYLEENMFVPYRKEQLLYEVKKLIPNSCEVAITEAPLTINITYKSFKTTAKYD